MAEIIISILRIASVLCTCNGTNTWYLCDLQENKDALYNAMEELKDIRDDVKRKVVEAKNNPNESMECNKEVSGWLERLQAIEGEVAQILLKADEEIKGRCFEGYCSINYWSRYKIGKLVMQTLTIVKDLKTKAGTFGDVAYKLPPSLVEKEAAELTVGMESMFDKVWRLLAKDEVRILGLFGQGGVGKTTLLKQINNAFEAFLQSTSTTASSSTATTHGFDVVILVVMSKVINIKDIQKEIGDRLGLSSPNEKNIRKALSKKNFVLLLDDIWERVDLQSIGIPPPHENTKSKVVFTTRSEAVCGLMEAKEMLKVECLPWNEAWSLFQEKVGERALNSFPRARELAKDVARECGGLPLALITIGRAMFTKRSLEEWNHAITTLRRAASEFPGMGDDVFPLLKVSYDSLGKDTIKSCFLYCALFPEDESIKKSKLIDYWIGEGLISLNEFDHIDEARNHGHDIIGILKGACLLESGRKEKTRVKMHDTIRDMALWIAHECGSKRNKICITHTEMFSSDLTDERSWYNAERIYLTLVPKNEEMMMLVRSPPPPPPLKSPNLITLIYGPLYYLILSVLPQNFFEFTTLLRVLDLSNSGLETFPISITELLELRYLSLSRTLIQVLPEELGKLVKLNYLDLSYMEGLREIPRGVIGSLVESRVFNLFNCGPVDLDIEEVYKLKHLKDFGISIKTQHNLIKLLSNKNLQMCTRHLNLRYFDQQSEYRPQSTSSSFSVQLLFNLQFLFNLETLILTVLVQFPEADDHELMIMNMVGIQQQQLLGSSCFQNLSKIVIWHCNGFKDLTWVGYVPNLKTLFVDGCEEIVIIVDDLGGSTGGGSGDEISMVMNNVEDVFKKLKSLGILHLPKLKSICRNALAFPCLESMEVVGCPQLKKLPFDSASNINNTLQIILGGQKWWSELQWGEENNNDDDDELLKSKFLPYFVTDGGFDDHE